MVALGSRVAGYALSLFHFAVDRVFSAVFARRPASTGMMTRYFGGGDSVLPTQCVWRDSRFYAPYSREIPGLRDAFFTLPAVWHPQ
ncbi:hypothetical protein KCP71_10720 [Salmonella enterica subsp. enterica]|nr:hypothetical protein KCP71_10720 [Salmonella enterica subsp. enterica]